jgi:hypothetical protein
VDALEVEVIEKRVVVRGRVASFHLKQLAIQGVFDIIGSNSESTLEIDLQVIVVPLVQDGDVT